MELKPDAVADAPALLMLLIVPYGIETGKADLCFRTSMFF